MKNRQKEKQTGAKLKTFSWTLEEKKLLCEKTVLRFIREGLRCCVLKAVPHAVLPSIGRMF